MERLDPSIKYWDDKIESTWMTRREATGVTRGGATWMTRERRWNERRRDVAPLLTGKMVS